MSKEVSNLKVGDEVRVRSDLKEGGRYFMSEGVGDIFTHEMSKFKGKNVTIQRIYEYSRKYLITEDSEDFFWTDEMFEHIEKQEVSLLDERIRLQLMSKHVIYNNPATILFYHSRDGKLRKSVAKCSPEDKYDKEIGYRVALLKAFRKEIDRELKRV
jgi:hypothetical protein